MDLCNEKDCKYFDKKYECNCFLGDSTEIFETCQNNNLRFKSPQKLPEADAYSLLADVGEIENLQKIIDADLYDNADYDFDNRLEKLENYFRPDSHEIILLKWNLLEKKIESFKMPCFFPNLQSINIKTEKTKIGTLILEWKWRKL